jgi:hypothetical protein
LIRKYKGKRPLGRPSHRYEFEIKMGVGEVGWKGVDWIYLSQDRVQWQAVVNMLMNLQVL